MRPEHGRGHVLACLLVVLLASIASVAQAHEFRPGLLRVRELPAVDGRAGVFELVLLAPRVGASGPIPEGALQPIVPSHCQQRARTLDCGAEGLVGTLGVDGLDQHPVDVLVEVRYLDGTRVTAVLGPDEPTTTIQSGAAAGSSAGVFREYLWLGVEHILLGLDHLLFVLGLVLLVRDRKALVWTVTAFTLAHSLTLAAATLELVRLPSPPVEAGIALSILLLARELALGLDDPAARDTLSWRYPWLVAFAFGLLHGFGFAGALHEVGLPSDQIPAALLAFNLGVELGQLAVVGALLASFVGLRALARGLAVGPRIEQFGRGLPIWAMGTLAFAWTLERVLGFWS